MNKLHLAAIALSAALSVPAYAVDARHPDQTKTQAAATAVPAAPASAEGRQAWNLRKTTSPPGH